MDGWVDREPIWGERDTCIKHARRPQTILGYIKQLGKYAISTRSSVSTYHSFSCDIFKEYFVAAVLFVLALASADSFLETNCTGKLPVATVELIFKPGQIIHPAWHCRVLIHPVWHWHCELILSAWHCWKSVTKVSKQWFQSMVATLFTDKARNLNFSSYIDVCTTVRTLWKTYNVYDLNLRQLYFLHINVQIYVHCWERRWYGCQKFIFIQNQVWPRRPSVSLHPPLDSTTTPGLRLHLGNIFWKSCLLHKFAQKKHICTLQEHSEHV